MGFADTIVALENGRIVEVGNSQQQLSSEGYFAKLGLTIPGEEIITEHSEDTNISRVESNIADSLLSVSNATDMARNTLDAKRKNGDWSVYSYYLASSGYKTIALFVLSMAAWIFCTEFGSKCTTSRSEPCGS